MANVINTNFSYTWPGQTSTDVFIKPSLQTPEIKSLFEVRTGIKSGAKLNVLGSLSKITKADQGCSPSPQNNPISITDRPLDTAGFQVELAQCADVFNATVMESLIQGGYDKNDITGTQIRQMVEQIVLDGMRRDHFRIFSFGDTGAVSADYDQIDGLWRQLIDGVSTYCVKKIDITALSQNANQRALDWLRLAYAQAPILLKQFAVNELAILCTGNFYENLMTTYEDKSMDGGGLVERTENGVTGLAFRGIKILPVYTWDNDLADSANPFFGTFNTAFIFTTPKNHVIGIDRDQDDSQVKIWYSDDEDRTRIRAKYNLGYTYLHCDLQVIGYGQI
jgi:hypothetical protein